MAYDIFSEDDNMVIITDGDITFEISKFDNNALIRLANGGMNSKDVVIPHVFPSGHCIDSLFGTYYSVGIEGSFGKITISDGIKVGRSAFCEADVQEVVWNDCPCIPTYCFDSSELERIYNIQNVEIIEEHAFSDSCIREITWSDKCKAIPKYCFYGAALQSIDNLDAVESVGRKAFALSPVECLDFSKTTNLYLERSSLVDLSENCEVILSYYIDKDLLELARQ